MDMAEKIKTLRDAGVSVAEIAAKYELSVRRVYQILGTARAKPRATDAQVEEIRRRHRLRESIREIASAMKMSRKTVTAIIGEDPAAPAAPLTDEEFAHIQVRAATHRSPAEIAREIGRSTAGVRKAIESDTSDWIRDAVIARATEMQIYRSDSEPGAYRLMRLTEGRVSEDTIARFFRGGTISTRLLQHILTALRLRLIAE
jgi:DNA-binding transcriptional MerR regulator